MSISTESLLTIFSGKGRTGKLCQRMKVKIVDDGGHIFDGILRVLAASCRPAGLAYIE